jgi:cell division protein FtsI (penicillin-binding protein 3)
MSQNKKRSDSVVVVYIIFILLLIGVTYRYGSVSIGKYDEKANTRIGKRIKAKRGSIITSDGYHIAYTTRAYSIGMKNYELPIQNRDIFMQMLSIYGGVDKSQLRAKFRKARRRSYITLANNLNFQQFQNLKELAREFRNLDIMVGERKNGIYHFEGLNGQESGAERNYPYGDTVTPIVGYTQIDDSSNFRYVVGKKGIEKEFEEFLKPQQDGITYGDKDALGNIIRNSSIKTQKLINGADIHLNLKLAVQRKIEVVLDKYKRELGAKEVIAGVMESKTGKVLALASSNRYIRKELKPEEISYLQVKATEHLFEAGSVLKPIVYAIVLDKKLLRRGQFIDCENGRYKVGRKIITDEHRMKSVPAEEIIIHSSNIGMIKITEALNGIDFNLGLRRFGFGSKSGMEVSRELEGKINTPKQLNSITYKATASFGMGFTVNFVQLLKATNVFNNDGKIVTPKLVSYIKFGEDDIQEVDRSLYPDGEQVISVGTSRKMKNILVRTVKEGTGKKTDIDGLEIGGKTGTAHIAKGSRYVNEYHSSFFGFANDKKNKYTIGVTTIEPARNHFASKAAVPVFKEIVEVLVDNKHLEKFN